MARSAASRAEARFRQLSCLGFRGELSIPAMLHELHAVIPAHANTFFFAGKWGVTARIHFENPDFVKVFPIYQQEFHERRDHEFKGLAFWEAARTQFGVHEFSTSVGVDQKTFEAGDLYNLILRPVGNDSNFLRVIFRNAGKVLGGLSIYRSIGAGAWTTEEKRRLAALEPFFVHALTAPMTTATPMVDSGKAGLIIANADGKPLYFSAEGRRLLFLATSSRDLPEMALSRAPLLPAAVSRLCRNLSRIFSDDITAPAPIHRHTNVWGGFTFQAHWLERGDPTSGRIAITVAHQVPLPVRMIRSIGQLPLSGRQAEVCLLLASGASHEEIAERLGISKHTTIAHGRWIYHKLDVHNRAELVNRILSQ